MAQPSLPISLSEELLQNKPLPLTIPRPGHPPYFNKPYKFNTI